ncbi:SPOR domain-containing protein [Candidatus Marinimicrobia bacterium]|nr:SPOR domain-containing protein [Candidatus Neomarinimicrobiota bacterium]
MKLVLVLFLMKMLNGQDSLFWFDMSSVMDSIPKTPKTLDRIFGSEQLSTLDSLIKNRSATIDGFRLQIFESSSVDEATKKFNKFKKILSDSLYLTFEAPFYKVRYGDFVSKQEAETEKKKLSKKGLKNIWTIRSRIKKIR